MEFIKTNYDRVLMVVAALLAVVFGGMLALKAMGLKSEFERPAAVPKSEFGESGEEAIAGAAKHFAGDFAWSSPTMEGVPQKPLPLFVPVPIYVKNGVEIDLLDPQSPDIRPPIKNAYIFEHRLDGGRSDLNTLDLDGDGFTTEEEFLSGKTDPNDPQSHPALTDKLFVAEIKTDTYRLSYRTGDNPEGDFGVREETDLFLTDPPRDQPRKKSHFIRMNVEFGAHPGHEKRYKITAFEQKEVPARIGDGVNKIGIVTVADAQGAPFKLEQREARVVNTHYALFHYSLPAVDATLARAYKQGEKFKLPGAPELEFEVLEVPADASQGVKIRQLAGPDGTPKDLVIMPLAKK